MTFSLEQNWYSSYHLINLRKEASMEQTNKESLFLLIKDFEKKLNRPLKRAEITLLKSMLSKKTKS